MKVKNNNPKLFITLMLILFINPYLISNDSSPKWNAIKDYLTIDRYKAVIIEDDKESLLLLGFDTGHTANDTKFYDKIYDNNDKGLYNNYQPFTTIGIIRTGNNISVKTAPYLIVPTINGFKFINLINNKNIMTKDMDEDLFYEDLYNEYKWSQDNTNIFITANKEEILDTLNKTVTNGNALSTYFETVDYITPNFLIKSVYDSYVTYSASGVCTNVFVELVSFKNSYPKKLRDLIPETKYIEILRNAYRGFYGDYPNGSEPFPWGSGPWFKKDDGVFTLFREKGMINLRAIIPYWGSSSRKFLASYDLGIAPELLVQKTTPFMDFDSLKQINPEIVDMIVTPDNATVYLITDTEIAGFNINGGELLTIINLPELFPSGFGNKIIMVESALGKYVPKWEEVFIE